MAWQDRAYNREDSFGGGGTVNLGFAPPTRVALLVMAACFVCYLLQQFSPLVTDYGCLTLDGILQPWRFVTYQYLHGSPGHIFFNLLGIYFFFPPLERLWGPRSAFLFYTAGGAVAGVFYCLLAAVVPQISSLVGASGSVLACLGACAILFPEMRVLLIIIPVSIRALAIILALFYTLSIIGARDLANAAHLGGLVFGAAGSYFGMPLWRSFQRNSQIRSAQRNAQRQAADEALIDRILEKVQASGMNSLTRGERKALKDATERQRQAELTRARRAAR